MGDAAALSIAKDMMEGYNLEGECLSLYGGSDFITGISLRPLLPQPQPDQTTPQPHHEKKLGHLILEIKLESLDYLRNLHYNLDRKNL